jgi:hypothetical protein
VESYGRDAVLNPAFDAPVNSMLDSATKELDAAGFGSRSAFLRSPTAGGGSWLAHATFHSGLWIHDQDRYNSLAKSDRLTLGSAFRKAGWNTVGYEPGTTTDWPEAGFFGFNTIHDDRTLAYQGPKFSWSTMPDQYTLAEFQRQAYGQPHRKPLMAEVTLTSSHTPWAPLPSYVDWKDVGNGSIYDAQQKAGKDPGTVWKDAHNVQVEYERSIQYSLTSLVSWVKTYGDANLVLVFLGDHQPATIVTGRNAIPQVPVTIVAHDPKVLDQISGWGWQNGLRPNAKAPYWNMDAFRDKFLTAFGSKAQ